MTKIKVHLEVKGSTLHGQILEMPEELRDTGLILEGAGYTLSSFNHSELFKYDLYLKGLWREGDNDKLRYLYKTEKRAEEAKAEFEKLIKQVNDTIEAEATLKKSLRCKLCKYYATRNLCGCGSSHPCDSCMVDNFEHKPEGYKP